MRLNSTAGRFGMGVIVCATICTWIVLAQRSSATDQIARLRNLGKAFYENPTTQAQAVEQFRLALALAGNSSAPDRLNYGLALLRSGKVEAGIAQLEAAQKLDPQLAHTWFNLGIAFKREGNLDAALAQLKKMETLVPRDAVTHYQIGSILKSRGETGQAVKEFETARDLNPRLAAPHFQLYGLYRQVNRAQDAAAELRIFQDLKKQQEGDAVPEDIEWSVYSEIYDPVSARPAAALALPIYRSEKLAAGGFTGVTAIDLDGGVHPSLIAWSPERVAVFRNGVEAAADSGLRDLRGVISIAPGDFDNDGLPDLCVITARGAELFHNTNGTFRKQSDLANGSFRQAVWIDFDHDYDLDLALLGDHPKLLRNNGSAGFSDETARFPFVAGQALEGVPFDLEPDTPGFDLAVSYQDRAGVLYRDKLGGSYESTELREMPAGSRGLIAYDFNHDSRTDLAAIPDLLLLNLPRGFDRANRSAPRGVAFAQDGKENRAYIQDGALMIDRDVTPNYGNWIEVALTGVKNIKTAIAAKVEVKAGSSYEKQTYAGLPLVFRLGAQNQVDTVRVTWPNGLIQNETNQQVNRLLPIKEAPRLSGSCPMIFTWNGERFTFITDVLGVAPLGASSGDGRYFPVDHDEYVSIPADKLRQRDGDYEVRVTEELHEVSYIDQIKLQALDHPADIGIVTNEKFKSPPFPDFRLFGVKQKIYPTAARDQNNSDVRPALLQRDSVYPDSFDRNQAGVASLHKLDLDFGNAAASNHAVLVLYGWVDWADGSTFLSAMQEHKDLTFPYLQVKDAAGVWRTVVEDMGIPSGKPKPMAVDLSGKFLSASREVRIVTNLCVYWDEAYLVESDDPPPARLTSAAVTSADLHFRGFSKPAIDPLRKQPEGFDYQSVATTSQWNPTHGNYTRYGDVKTLLAEPDDRMVVMGSGDEIRLRFSASGLPPLPTGWERDFLLLVDGWAKDADANTAFSQTVLPLPFHAMSSYPYPTAEHYPSDRVHEDYVREYNTRPALRLIRRLSRGTD
ncbi:MAG TPA: FG-GAP-like repeat-containing protein [Bryobacteraceae bacterium]|nr:FG-GAP-like repeat-containing protein [Bryobacteraceae bacterium]